MHLSRIQEQQLLYSTTNKLTKDHKKGSSSLKESLSMTDKSFLQETCKEIWRYSYTSLHAFLNFHDSQFCPQGESFYI